MGDRVAEERAYQRAAEIADRLLAEGVPVLRFGASDLGAKVAFAFQLADQRASYALRVPVEEATVERVRALYRAVS